MTTARERQGSEHTLPPASTSARVLKAIGAVVLFLAGLFIAPGVFRSGGRELFAGIVVEVILLTLSAITAHAARLLVLEALLGTLIMAKTGLLLFYTLSEASYGHELTYHICSVGVIALGCLVYVMYRRKAK